MKTLAYCWSCNKEHDITNKDVMEYGLKCDCGGFIVSPSGKVNSKIVAETKEDMDLLGIEFVKLYQIFLQGDAGWVSENADDFETEIEEYNETEEINIPVEETIIKIAELKIGEEYEIEGLKFKCIEMESLEFESLHEFSGW